VLRPNPSHARGAQGGRGGPGAREVAGAGAGEGWAGARECRGESSCAVAPGGDSDRSVPEGPAAGREGRSDVRARVMEVVPWPARAGALLNAMTSIHCCTEALWPYCIVVLRRCYSGS